MKINDEIIKILYEMAELYEMEGVVFKPRAFARAAESMEAHFDHSEENVKTIYKKGGIKALEEIPGVGKGIAERIEEYLKTGKIKEYEKMKKKTPISVMELTSIEGVGPKTMKLLYEELGIKNLKDLEKAAKAGKLASLPRLGEKIEQKILKGLEFYKRHEGRFLLGEVYGLAKKLEKKYGGVVAGSFRRWEETVGDLDILIPSPHPKVGEKRDTLRFENGLKSDLRFIDKKDWGSALQYFTGNKEHNIELRKIAIKKGFKLNEYGIKTEEEVYEKLGMQFIPPEMRNNTGEIELALKNKLPKLVERKDIKGDLHCHSHWLVPKTTEERIKTVEERIEKAKELGYEYLGISDHTKFLAIEHGLNEEDLLKQSDEFKKLKIKNSKIKLLHGCEANILGDGSIDIKDEVLGKLDYVIAGVHSQFKMTKKEMTDRLIKAMENPHVDIISHPTGRVLQRRGEYEFDFDEVLKAAKRTGIVLEINSNPIRLDLNAINIKKAKEAGVKMIINSDAHNNDQMDLIKFGVHTARRGWAIKKDIVNTMPFEELKNFFKRPKGKRSN